MTRDKRPNDYDSPVVTVLMIKLSLPGVSSLKGKRGRLQRIVTAIRQHFNVSVSEIGFNDSWQSTLLGCAMISNDAIFNRKMADQIVNMINSNFPDELIETHSIEVW